MTGKTASRWGDVMAEAQPETQFDIEAWYETSVRRPRDWHRWMRLNLTTGTLIATASAVAAVLTALFAIGQIDAANGQKVDVAFRVSLADRDRPQW